MNDFEIDWDKIDSILVNALKEDVGSGDITTDAIFPSDATCEARIISN